MSDLIKEKKITLHGDCWRYVISEGDDWLTVDFTYEEPDRKGFEGKTICIPRDEVATVCAALTELSMHMEREEEKWNYANQSKK